MRKIVFYITIIGLINMLFTPTNLRAAETMFFDSTDKYLGACQLTDKSEWELKEEVTVSKFEVWYNWSKGETELPVKIFKDGVIFAEFRAARTSCDPYQQQWCNADFAINKVFPRGKYTTDIPNKRQCLKPGGTGTIRLYKEDTQIPTTVITPTITPTPISQQAAIPSATVTPVTTNSSVCNCNTKAIVTTAGATSVIVSIIFWLILGRR